MSETTLDSPVEPKDEPTQAKYYSVKKAAAALDVSEKTIRRKVESGEYPHKRVGVLIRIPRRVIDEELEGLEVLS